MAIYNKNTTTAEYGNNNSAVGELQTYLNSKGANLAVDNKYGPLTQAAVAKYGTNSNIPNPSPITSPVKATDVKPAPSINLPEPQAGNIYDTYTTSLAGNVDNIRTNLESTYKTQLADVQAKKDALQKKQDEMLKNINPENRATYDQEQKIMVNELNAAEAASGTIASDFAKRRALTSELDNLLNQGTNLIKQQKGMAVGQGVINKRVANTMTDISARTGVIEAVFSALDGNISQAYNIIGKAKETVSAQWKDNLDYYGTLLDLNNNKILNLNKDEKEIAEKQVALIEGDMKKIDATEEYLKKIMIDPESAQFVADAGIKLTDSVEEINTKLATQSKVEEIKDAKNKMAEDGYIYVPFPGKNTAGLVAMSAGDQTLYFKEPLSKTKTTASKTVTATQTKNIFADFLKTGIAPSGESFGNPMGADGYVDPGVYIAAFTEWPGTTKDFLLQFPIKQYVNPESYSKLPAALQETLKSKSDSASGMSDEAFLELLNK